MVERVGSYINSNPLDLSGAYSRYRVEVLLFVMKTMMIGARRRFLRRFLERLDVDCVLDVGANVGDFVKELRIRLVLAHRIDRPYLKMDTQGFDLEVFSGASGALDRIVGMQSEVSVKRIYEGIPDCHRSIERYQSAGFELAGLFSVIPWEDELIELNCYMLNRGRT